MSEQYISFPDRGPSVFAVTTATLVLASFFVFARMVCRLGIVRRIGWDDYFILFAWLLAFGLSLTIDLGTRNGLGRHDANIPPEGRAKLRRCEYVFSILYVSLTAPDMAVAALTLQNPALMATKTSILIFYLRLSKNTQKLLRWGSFGVLVIVNVAGVVLTIINIFQCRPVAAAFSDVAGQCIPLLTEFICSAPVNIITDLAILALPIPVLTGMHLPSRQKTILVLTFALGIFVTIIDVVRIYYLQQAINIVQTGTSSDPDSIFGDSVDFSWNASLSLMWSAVEVNVSITCACIPTLKPLIIKILPAMLIDPEGSSFSSSRVRDLDVSDAASHNTGSRPHTLSQQGTITAFAKPDLPKASSTLTAPTATGVSSTHPYGEPEHATSVQMFRSILPASDTHGGSKSPGAREPNASGSSHHIELDLDFPSDLDVDQHPGLAINRIATADHVRDFPTLSPATSRRRDTVGRGGPASPRPPLTRAASSTRFAFGALSNALHGTTTGSSAAPDGSKDKSLYFGFVNLHTPKNMLEASASESIKYCTIVAVLFFLWGFSYGLLNTLNNVVAAVTGMTTTQTLGLTSAYFGGGYFFGPLLIGTWVLRHDEQPRRRSTGLHRHSSHHEGEVGARAALPSAVANVVGSAASVVTHHSHHAVDGEIPVGGFKATFMVGLCFYGVGTMMFWPSSVLTSFPGFLISSFVVGFGLSILETAANPFIALCGPMEYSETRLIVVQAAQGIGSVLSGLLAQNVFFVDVGAVHNTSAITLLDVQWTYLAITLFCVALAMFFYYIPLPEVHDAELNLAASRLPVDGKKKSFFGLQLRTVCLLFAIFAQWTYVASQESMSIYFHHLVTLWLPETSSANGTHSTSRLSTGRLKTSVLAGMATTSFTPDKSSDHPPGLTMSVPNALLVGRTAFTVSRFFTGYILYLGVKHPKNRWLPKPRTILAISAALMTLFSLLTVVLPPSKNANLILVPLCLYFFAEGPIWPLIFSIGLRGQGARTKRAAAYITMAASGPLFWPYVMYVIMDRGGTMQIAFIIVVVLMAACTTYPLFLTFHKDARELTKVAPLNPLAAGVEPEPAGGGTGGEEHDEEKMEQRDPKGNTTIASDPLEGPSSWQGAGTGDALSMPNPPAPTQERAA